MSGPPVLEFAFDVVCPYAYLASTRIEAIAARTGAELRWEPILLGGVFREISTGVPGLPGRHNSVASAPRTTPAEIGQSDDPNATMSEAKRRHTDRDLFRWAEHFEVPLVRRADHPRRSVLAMRAILATPEADRVRAIHALFAAYHVRGEDFSSGSVVEGALTGAGLDGPALVQRAELPEIKDELRVRTARAVERGVFGVPAMFVGGELYWGQDRLDWVQEALSR